MIIERQSSTPQFIHGLDILHDCDDSDNEEKVEVVSDIPVEQGRAEDVAAPGGGVKRVTAKQDHTLLSQSSAMNVDLGNLVIGHMVNGFPDSPIDLRTPLRQVFHTHQHSKMVAECWVPPHDAQRPQQSKGTL